VSRHPAAIGGAENRVRVLLQGRERIHIIEPTKAVGTVASSDFGAPGPVIDFQPP